MVLVDSCMGIVKTLAKYLKQKNSEPMDGKEQCQGSNCFFSSRKLFHVPESFHRWHGMVFDTSIIGLLQSQ